MGTRQARGAGDVVGLAVPPPVTCTNTNNTITITITIIITITHVLTSPRLLYSNTDCDSLLSASAPSCVPSHLRCASPHRAVLVVLEVLVVLGCRPDPWRQGCRHGRGSLVVLQGRNIGLGRRSNPDDHLSRNC